MRSRSSIGCGSRTSAGRSSVFPSACASWRGAWRATTSPERTRSSPSSEAAPAPGIPRLDFRIERLKTSYRFSYAFHAREVRFERDTGAGFENVFPETFSFRAERHDPAELYLRLEDLWGNPRRLGPEAGRRDCEELVLRLLAALPRTLSSVLDRLRANESESALLRAAEDVAVFAQIALRFVRDKQLQDHPRVRMATFHLRQLVTQAFDVLVRERVRPEFREAYVAGHAAVVGSEDPTDVSFFYALAAGEPERIDAALMGAAERAWQRWIEGVCLDDQNGAFEVESSPFSDRASEVLRAVARPGIRSVSRARDLSPFLRRPGNRDCLRILARLELWFLRQYDVHHAAVMRHHAEALRAGAVAPDRMLSRHGRRAYLLALGLPALPLLAAVFLYERAPRLFDWLAALEVSGLLALMFWFLVYRFLIQKDVTFFHTSVPRIGAGIIVGYLPVFLIDEVWDLARQPLAYLLAVVVMLGFAILLYLYVEVHSRLGDARLAFARALDIFLLGMIESAGLGMIVTSLLGPLMAARNWGLGQVTSLAEQREALSPFLGELPRVLGVEPFWVFPSAVLLMSVLAFFIGTFLQLLWEDLPITEPL
jgi:hypothetical protein